MSKAIHLLSNLFSELVVTFLKKKDDEEMPKESMDALLKQFQQLETSIQSKLLKQEELLPLAVLEPRLKGKFPVEEYKAIYESETTIFARLLILRQTLFHGFGRAIDSQFLEPFRELRKEMVVNVILNFYLLAEAIASKNPLPRKLAPAAQSRQKLLLQFNNLVPLDVRYTHELNLDYLYFYAYALSLKSVIEELDKIAVHEKNLFGETSDTGHFFD